MRKMKKWLALALALCMAVPNVAGLAGNDVRAVYAAEESPANWDEWATSLSKDAAMAVQLTGDDQKFNGTKVLDVSDEYAESIKTVAAGSIILRFKANSTASTGVILGTRNSAASLPADVTKKDSNASAMMLTTAGKFRFVYSYDGAEVLGPSSFTDGNWHTVVLSGASTGKNIRITIDGKEIWNISNRADLAGMFSRQSVIDLVTIGGHKSGNSVIAGFNGLISDVIVTSKAISDADAIALSAAGCAMEDESAAMGTAIASTMMNISLRDNTWLFTGGEAVQGGFDQTRGIRNYIGQFEEYVRWVKIDGSPVYGRQRYTFNTGAAGRTITDVVNNFEDLVAAFKTKATVYMVGVEDYSQGAANVDTFKNSLKSFIDQSLALKNGQGFVVIQKPFAVNDAAANANIETYCAAVDAVVEKYSADAGKYARIMVVDHYTATKNDADFKANKLTDNKLNAKGHLAIGEQFAAKVVNYTGSAFPSGNVTLNRVEMDQPDEYLDVLPTATAGEDSLTVVIPAVNGVDSWKYELDMDGMIVSGTAEENSFDITGLAAGKAYVLKIQSADGEKQLVTTMGTISKGAESAKYAQTLDANQQKIAARMAKDEPMTWLFMGDSITHASGLTFGYDGIAQAFEKFVKEGLGRSDDIVLNTAVANADTNTTIEQLDQRLTNYNPDVVSLMIGTNDCSSRVNITVDGFRTNMETILDTITTKYPNAVVIIRSMTPFFNDGNREPYREAYMNVVKELAEKYDTIYVDQYTALAEAASTYTWLPRNMFTDNLHPEANGHRIMTNMFIKACGLWTEDLPMTNLFYEMGITEESNAAVPSVVAGADQIGVSVADLESKSGLSLGDVVLKATSKENGQTYEVSVKDGENYAVLSGLPGETAYTVEVSAHLTASAKKVTFANVEVTLSDDAEAAFDVYLNSNKVKDLKVGAVIGTLSVAGLVEEGEYTYSLCAGEGSRDNALFEISGNQLKVKGKLVEGQTYQIRVKAVNGTSAKEQTFELLAVGKQLIFEKSNLTIGSTPVDLSGEAYAGTLLDMEEGTIAVKYTSTSNYGVQSLFSIANGTAGNNNRHFHVYVTPAGRLGCEIRNDSGLNYHIYADGAVTAGEETTIVFKADADKQEYKLFANGELVKTHNASGNFRFAEDITGTDTVLIGATKRGGTNAYSFGGTIHDIQVYGTALSDEEIIEMTAATKPEPPVELENPFDTNGGTGANYSRIPAMITTKDGVVIAAADSRFGGTHDSPNNIDIMVATSEDNGATWSAPKLVFHYDDYADDTLDIPQGTQTRVTDSASFIDPILLQDDETERVFLIADAMYSGTGSPQAVTGSGYKEIDGVKYMMLKKNGESAYNYSLRENNVIWNDITNTATEYSLNANFEILKDGVLQTVKQKTSSVSASGGLTSSKTNVDVAMNIMYADAAFKPLPTTWLYMKYSDDNGQTWSDPVFLNGMVKPEDSRIFIVGPGRGTQIKNGEYAGRLIVPVYDASKAGIIYSDDHGETWTYAPGASTAKAAMSETQIVELPDGTLRVFARSNNSKIATAVSLDGGETWSDAEYIPGLTQPGWGSQLSVMTYSEEIDGKPAIILSSPAGVGTYRRDGRVKIGLINETQNEGEDKYLINWVYDYQVDAANVGYAYSCLTELTNGDIGLLYEKYDSYNPAELHAKHAIKYESFTLEELMAGGAQIYKDAFNADIAAAAALTKGYYSDETWTALTAALEAAQTVAANNAATQDHINDAHAALLAAVNGLEFSDDYVDPTDSSKDLPIAGMKLTAGTLETTEGSLEALFDGNPDTFYHSNWSGTRPTANDFWIVIELPEETAVSGMRYLPRQSSPNGRILSYEISYSLDGKEWIAADSGDWADDFSWKVAKFDESVTAKYVKIFAVDSKADNSGRHMTAAELRVIKGTVEVEPDPEPTPEVCEVFPDVEHNAWYEDAVQYVFDNGIMSGNNGLFNPTGNITRAQVVTTLYNIEGRPEVTDHSAVDELVDVQAGAWYTDAVCWAYSVGVASGNNVTKMFNMNNPVTRQQLATFFYKYAELKGFDTETRKDISDMAGADQVADYAIDTMQWAVGTGLITGSAATVNGVTVYDLKPTGTATRAQMASILMRFCEGNDL